MLCINNIQYENTEGHEWLCGKRMRKHERRKPIFIKAFAYIQYENTRGHDWLYGKHSGKNERKLLEYKQLQHQYSWILCPCLEDDSLCPWKTFG